MGQSRRGAPHLLEAQRPLLILRILQIQTFTVKEKTVLPVLSVAFFAVTVYTVRALTLVGVPLMVRFTEVDVSSANNDNDGYYNASNYPNSNAFAALKADGSIAVRGSSNRGGEGAPSGNNYTKIYSNWTAFVLHDSNHPTP
jgi:hypothetical protein